MTKKLRILHIADYVMPPIGYQEFLLPKWNVIHGHEAYILCSDRYARIKNYEQTWKPILGKRICGKEKVSINGVYLERLPTVEVMRRVWLVNLEKRVQEINPDVVWVHGTASPSSFRIALLCRKLKKPLIMDNHQCFVASRGGLVGKIYYGLLKFLTSIVLNSRVDNFVGVAQECCDFMVKRQGILPEKIDLIPLGVDTDVFKPSQGLRNEMRQELSISDDAIVVMQTGKLDFDRRPDWLGQALMPLMVQRENVWLVYVGGFLDGGLEQLREYFDESGILDRVIFHPFVPQWELPKFFNGADICVYPGFSSLSCLEAGACERAVIVNDLPAGRERAESGIGLSYRNGDIEDLRALLSQLIEKPAYRRSIGIRARDYVINEVSYECISSVAEQKMIEILQVRNNV